MLTANVLFQQTAVKGFNWVCVLLPWLHVLDSSMKPVKSTDNGDNLTMVIGWSCGAEWRMHEGNLTERLHDNYSHH